MTPHKAIRLLALIIGFAITSPRALAQLPPPPEPPSPDAAAVRPSSIPGYSDPISDYVRPTENEKLRLYFFDAFGPYAFTEAVFAGGIQQVTKSPPEWGGRWNGFGERAASSFGIQLMTTTTRYGLAKVFHEDAAYYRCECTGFLPRVGHALISTLTARQGEEGQTVFSIPGLVSPYAGTMTSLAWYPGRFGVKDGLRMGNYNLLGQAAGNLALEFIYGGPHTMFSRLRSSKSQGGVGPAQNP
jgi:hypothetical protein